jgi:hypothetical protein
MKVRALTVVHLLTPEASHLQVTKLRLCSHCLANRPSLSHINARNPSSRKAENLGECWSHILFLVYTRMSIQFIPH